MLQNVKIGIIKEDIHFKLGYTINQILIIFVVRIFFVLYVKYL